MLAWRASQLARFELQPDLVQSAIAYYSSRPVEFINHWVDTYDPRNAGTSKPVRLPFILFPRQAELIGFLLACVRDEQNGLVEKCRDMGATWGAGAFSVWLWRFWSGASVGWGSRKKELVDRIGDPDSIFEKLRMLVLGLPSVFLPAGFDRTDNLMYMRILNPENGSTITGEVGDNIGRGGRKLIYFKDESAHYERPELIEAALSDNTRVQIDISSVNGPNNVFHRKRDGGMEWEPGRKIPRGITRVFVMDWRDHPGKTETWYRERKQEAERNGLTHIFAQEVERNYLAAVEGTIIHADWVRAAIDAHIKLGIPDTGGWNAGLDVADEGLDRNALVARKGIVIRYAEEWGERDTGCTARRAVDTGRALGVNDFEYDCIGVGSGVKAEVNRLKDDGLLPKHMHFSPWNAGASVLNPDKRVIPGDKDSPLNKDFFANMKAQAWWELRDRFYRTFRSITALEEATRLGRPAPKLEYEPDELISIDSKLPLLRQLERELSQPTASKGTRLKLVVNKTPDGTKSPNLGDATVMAFFPTARPPMKISSGLLARSANPNSFGAMRG